MAAQRYFIDPFALDGDRVAIPDAAPGDGSVSYDIGFGIKYQQDPTTTGLDIPRNQFNQLMFDITNALKILQGHGVPDFITSADNGGSPLPYDINSVVRYQNINYVSLINGNTDTPPTSNWLAINYQPQSFFTGDAVETYSATLPVGWLWMDGKTIGSAASGGTARANADTFGLFTVLWNSISNTVLPLQDNTGSPVARGASAAADFAANRRMPIPDKRGRVSAAADNLGGTAANVLNNFAQGGVNGTILGNFGGEANHALSSNENGTHSHSSGSMAVSGSALLNWFGSTNQHVHSRYPQNGASTGITSVVDTALTVGASCSVDPIGVDGSGFTLAGTSNTSGLGTAHNTVQPTLIANFRIKL